MEMIFWISFHCCYVAKVWGVRVKASEGEVVVFYFEPLKTLDLKSPGLSRRVNKMEKELFL
jgi:hypothetical protein